MSPASSPATRDISIGPALVSVPADWTVGPSPREGLVVLHQPSDPRAATEQQQPPGLIKPNLVLSFTENPASQGGVAQSAAIQLHTVLRQAPGTTLLAATPFATANGFPGRAHVVTGLYRRTPFQSNRWYVGVGDVVVEIVLTLPGEPQPDLLAAGTAAAYSVRLADPPHGISTDQSSGPCVQDSTPAIPLRRIDQALNQRLSADGVPEHFRKLEDIAEIISEVPRGRLPAKSLVISAEAADRMLDVSQVGNTTRFSGGTSTEVRELQQAGLHTGSAFTEVGEHLMRGVEGEPDLHMVTHHPERRSEGRVWIDGDEATLMLEEGERIHLLRELTASVPAILLAWSGQHGGWFVDVAAELSAASLEDLLAGGDHGDRHELMSSQLEDAAYLEDAFEEPASRFICTVAATALSLEWVHTARRGPFLIEDSTKRDRLQLRSTTTSVVYDYLVKLIQGL